MADVARTRTDEFAKSFQRLEKIVRQLEDEELSLDKQLEMFEEGIRLSRFCHRKLEEVEKKIELILADSKGEAKTEPFDTEDDQLEGNDEV